MTHCRAVDWQQQRASTRPATSNRSRSSWGQQRQHAWPRRQAGGGGRQQAAVTASAAAGPSTSGEQLIDYYATCHPGLEHVVATELESSLIGACDVRPTNSGVLFRGDQGVGYRANLWLRSAIRVLSLLAEAPLDPALPPGDAVYESVREAVPSWPNLLAEGQSFHTDGRCWSCTQLTSSQLLAIRAKDAICDAIRDRRGAKPAPPPPGRVADLPLFLSAFEDRLTIYRDMSGASLHRRGWRRAMHKASLNEAAAGGLLLLAGWGEASQRQGATLADPMVGSGTFAIEAAHIATRTAPGTFRHFWPFTRWPDYDPEAWEEAQSQAADLRLPSAPVHIWGNDIHTGALGLALRDAEWAGVRHLLRLHHGDARTWRLPHPPQLVICNPPWGQRLLRRTAPAQGGEEALRDGGWDGGSHGGGEQRVAWAGSRDEADELAETWYGLSVFLKESCGGATAAILCGNPEASKALRLKAAQRHPVTIGGIDCRLLVYGIKGRKGPAVPAEAAAAARGQH